VNKKGVTLNNASDYLANELTRTTA